VSLLVVGLGVGSVASGCATAVDTLEPLDEVAGDGGSSGTTDGGKTSAAGKSTSGGSKSSGGSSNTGGSGGTLTGAFGGSATTGGKNGTGGSATAGAGGKAAGGSAGTANGGSASGGSAGSASGGSAGSGGKSSGGSGGTGGAGGSANGGSGGSGTPLACLMSWKGDKCDTCSSQTQSDKLACADILNCYAANSCGPSTCGGNTDKCGANNIGKGTAGYPIAQTVYDCLCK